MQGQFELNVRIPLIARNLLQSLHLLLDRRVVFAEKCVDGIEANSAGTNASAGATLAVATALNGAIGYDKGTEIVQEADRLRPPAARGRARAGRRREALRQRRSTCARSPRATRPRRLPAAADRRRRSPTPVRRQSALNRRAHDADGRRLRECPRR